MTQGARTRVLFFAEIPTPYILPTLTELSRLVDLTVVFGARQGSRGMDWDFEAFPFRHEYLEGMTVRRARSRDSDIYLDPRMLRAMVRARPDAIIVPGFAMATACAALLRRLRGSIVLIYSDGSSHGEAQLSRAHRTARRVLMPRVDGCAALSTEAGRRFVELGCPPDRVFDAPHATSLGAYREAGAERPRHDDADLRVLSVGRLITLKGTDRLIEAIALARATEPAITLDLIGTGPEEERLRALAARVAPEAVRFHGFVDQPGLPPHYAAADAFALPSRLDMFGIAALEAAASRLPLVSSPFAGATTDLVDEGVSGFVVDPDDVEGMADRFVRLARDPELRRSMGEAAHERSLVHEPAVAARGYVTAIETVAAARVRPRSRPRARAGPGARSAATSRDRGRAR